MGHWCFVAICFALLHFIVYRITSGWAHHFWYVYGDTFNSTIFSSLVILVCWIFANEIIIYIYVNKSYYSAYSFWQIFQGADRKLQKGVSYHINMLVIGVLNGFLSLFGCPWLCAASVRTLTHINAVTLMSTNHAPGEKPKGKIARNNLVRFGFC